MATTHASGSADNSLEEGSLAHLLWMLELEKIEENIFRGANVDLGIGSVFGGQVLGQALSAACQTVEADKSVHSLHGYFLRPGDMKVPILYDVDRIRSGRSFTTRRVRAIQHGEAIFNMSVSFHISEDGDEHTSAMPDVQSYEGLESEIDLRHKIAETNNEGWNKRFYRMRPIEVRPVEPDQYPGSTDLSEASKAPRSQMWLRSYGEMPDDPRVHTAVLAYASDMHLLGTGAMPHRKKPLGYEFQMASLDHSMWFHRPFRADEWLLYSTESPTAQGARSLNFGKFFSADGTLVCSTAQEGLMRRFDHSKRKNTA